MWLSCVKSMRTQTSTITMRLCSTRRTSPQPKNDPPLSCKMTRLSTRSPRRRWTGSERTCCRSTWETPRLNNNSSSQEGIQLKRLHSVIISYRGRWWMRSAGRICHPQVLRLGFPCLRPGLRLGCCSSHNRNQLRRVLSLKKKEVKN